MAKERTVTEGVEEREVSDGSVEEISEADFKQEGGGGGGRSGRSGRTSSSSARVWRNHEYVQFPRYLSQNQMFSSFAWMQAVKNKPLGLTFGEPPATESDEVCVVSDSGEEDASAAPDGEKEEGELEEGEIDDVAEEEKGECPDADGEEKEVAIVADSAEAEDTMVEEVVVEEEEEEDVELEDLDQRVGSILEDLESFTEDEVEKSFDGACSKVLRAAGRLRRMALGGDATFMEAVIQQAFATIEAIHSVYLKTKEKNRESHFRFLSRMKDSHCDLFTTEQMKEINDMIPSIECEVAGEVKEEKLPSTATSVGIATDGNEFPSITGSFESKSICPSDGKESNPFLDCHVNPDQDRLPSPRREVVPLSVPALASWNQSVNSQPASRKPEEPVNLPYAYLTDAFTAVSSYHKKYDRVSFFSNDRLPSPTPSDDGDNGDSDMSGEVSSTFPVSGFSSLPFSSRVSVPRSSPCGLETSSYGISSQMNYGVKPATKVSAKNRDPRLRLASPNFTSALQSDKQSLTVEPSESQFGPSQLPAADSRKHKPSERPSDGDRSLKRQRNAFIDTKGSHFTSGVGGWLEDNGSTPEQSIQANKSMGYVGIAGTQTENGASNWGIRQDSTKVVEAANATNSHVQPTSTVPPVILPPVLKDIAVNPTMLRELLRAVQNQKQLGTAVELAPGFPNPIKPVMQASPSENISLKFSQPEQMVDAKVPIPSEAMNPVVDAGKPRMKPRDPRRILQNSTVQKGEGSATSCLKIDGTSPLNALISRDAAIVGDQGELAQTNSTPYLSTTPDVVPQFTKNLKIIANLMSSSSQGAAVNPAPPVVNTLTTSTKIDDSVAKVVTKGTNDQQGALAGERTSSDATPPDPWGDVDHLLDGYDDQQKAAIQKERMRRIEELNKMFSARKLSLVLDLDHTLLNSAKFTEVDQIHEEILRKKEELDRERPQRHLFRFQHMAMWTKLRPGIWNFLDKASKLYELHLYTMGNHLYATEMAKVLDPTGTLFSGRVISKGDENDPVDGDERVPRTKDLEGVKGMESAILIIDDSVKVWPHNRLNLIVVERYTYFPCSRRQFGLLGPSLLEIDHDERPEDGTLASSLAVIERIHQNFFAHPSLNNVDARSILSAEQRKILAGCRIVFSRIFPVGEANPHLHPLWQSAEQFGAACTNQIDDQVTHVVANSLGTDKVNWALSTGRYVVHPGWVEASALLYRRANEHDFAVKP